MAKHRRSHTKRRKSRRGGGILPSFITDNLPASLGGTTPAGSAQPALNAVDSAAQSSAPALANNQASSALGLPPPPVGQTATGGRRRRSRKTRRRRGGKYY